MGSQSQNVVHVLAALRNFTMSQKEKTLDELVQDNCLRYIEDDKIGLGVRENCAKPKVASLEFITTA
ncbi:hypothetical protein Patl1_37091 [Pistacia atlantica]|nr:hypothetical protein Patl1_37091 [Pistacia atlantica]